MGEVSKTVLVTGAAGHIGCNVVRALLEDGATVRGLVRRASDQRGLADLDIEIAEGDVLEPATLKRAFDGVDSVVHAAAAHRNFADDPEDILRPAVSGTRNVLDACAAAGVKRMVLTSSAATIGFAPDPKSPLDEKSHLESARAPYIRAKCEQEKLALADERVEVVVLNPSGVFGPHDYKLTPATRALLGLLRGDPAMFAVTVTDVRDVARAHVEALRSGVAGERYLVTGDVLAPAELSEAMSSIVGVAPRVMTPPRLLLETLAWWEERKARRTGADAPITRDLIADVWGKHLAYDGSKSRRELKMTYRPAREVLRDAVAWLLEQGVVPPKVAQRAHAGMARTA